jgi:spermidine synthase
MRATPTTASSPANGPPLLVRTEGDRRTLEFGRGNIQSAMSLADPDRLVLPYCRVLMAFTLFVPRPRHILLVGLGGGSLARFCHRHLPDCRITVLEQRADVIELARRDFGLPADDARLSVIHAEGASWLATQAGTGQASGATFDAVILDGYDARGIPAELASARFFSLCRATLRDGGVLATNLFSYDPHTPPMLARLGLIFNNRLCWLDGASGNNQVVFAIKAPPVLPPGRAPRALRVQAWLARRSGLGSPLLNRTLCGFLLWRLAYRSTRLRNIPPPMGVL